MITKHLVIDETKCAIFIFDKNLFSTELKHLWKLLDLKKSPYARFTTCNNIWSGLLTCGIQTAFFLASLNRTEQYLQILLAGG